MRYILTAGWDDGLADLTERLSRELIQSKRVLWLVSGGSNVTGTVQVMSNISTRLSSGLSVMLAGRAPPRRSSLQRAKRRC